MLDVLVTCHPHAPEPSFFPQVRGHYLAKHLARSGLQAEFRNLPSPGTECTVLICSEYQCDMAWFDRLLSTPLSEIRAERMFCLAEYSLGRRDHSSREYLDWFAARGGVLCQLLEEPLGPHEHWIGVGADVEAVGHLGPRDSVVFDFSDLNRNPDAVFDARLVGEVRRRLPGCRMVGTGPAGSSVAGLFDEWVPYGRPHADYIRAVLPRAFGVVVGLPGVGESMGLFLAEAQCVGAALVFRPDRVKEGMVGHEAAVPYERDEPGLLGDAVVEARGRDPRRIRSEASERFGYDAVVRRTRVAIGL